MDRILNLIFSSGCFHKFKYRHGIRELQNKVELLSADLNDAENF